MNGLYTPVEEEFEAHPSDPMAHWIPGIGYQSSGPKVLEDIAADSQQRTTLDDLARMADMANRVATIIEGYQNYADNIEEASRDCYEWAEVADISLAGVPEWWATEIIAQRGLRNALVKSLRETAQKVGETYGVK